MEWRDVGIDLPGGARGNVKVTCPQCSGTRRKSTERCLSVDVERGLWRCHHCGWSGALREDRPRHPPPPPPPKPVVRPAGPLPRDPAWREAVLAWFARRGIGAATVDAFVARGELGWRGAKQGAAPVLIFASQSASGETLAYKYRHTAEKRFWMEAGCEVACWGLAACRGARQVVVVEGELDRMALAEAGIEGVLAIPSAPVQPGSGRAPELPWLDRAVREVLGEAETVILAGDADPPGQATMDEIARRLGRGRIWRVTWPDGCKDANDVLLAHGPAGLAAAVAGARPEPVAGLIDPDDLWAAVVRYRPEPGVSTGWPELDAWWTVKAGYWTVLTGWPGSGKSGFLDALVVNLAQQHDWPCALYSPENWPVERHARRLVEVWCGARWEDLPGAAREEAWAAMRGLIHWIGLEDASVDDVLELAGALVVRAGIKFLVIDPWNELEHHRPPWQTETQMISETLSRIRRFAREHQVHVVVVHHPTPRRAPGEDGELPVPRPYEIADSANWFRKADHCLAIHRDRGAGTDYLDVHIQKVRFREVGRAGGCVRLFYDPPSGRFRGTR